MSQAEMYLPSFSDYEETLTLTQEPLEGKAFFMKMSK